MASAWILVRSSLMRSLSRATKFFQPLAESFETRLSQRGSSSRALVVSQKIFAHHAVAFGEPHQPAFVADQALVDVVKLLDQRIDARLIEPQRLDLLDDLFLELLRFAFLRRRQRFVLELVLDVEVLQAAQPLEEVGDVVEGLQHFRLELGLDGGERHGIFQIVLVEVGFGERLLRDFRRRRLALVACGLNGVAAGGAEGGATACGGWPAPRNPARRRPALRLRRRPVLPPRSWRPGRHKLLQDQ